MTTDATTAAIRAAALKEGENMGLVDKDLVGLLDTSDCAVGADGSVTGVTEALIALRKSKPHFFGLPGYTADRMTPAEQIRVLEQIRERDRERQRRRLAAKPLAPGEKRPNAKDMDAKTYAATLAAIKRRHA